MNNIKAASNALRNDINKKTKDTRDNTIVLIGCGVSAQIVALAAHETVVKPNMVIALDPAGSGFTTETSPIHYLNKNNDHMKVVTLHTNDGKYGVNGAVGGIELYFDQLPIPDSCDLQYKYNLIDTENTPNIGNFFNG